MADPRTITQAVSVQPSEAIAYLRQKVNVTSTHWADVWNEAHARAFMVAGAASEALVADLRKAVQGALENGTTLREFQKSFEQIVAKHGWVHNGTAAWRAKIIYTTNLSTAYSAGRYAQATQPFTLDAFPYWQYVHNACAHPRPQHVAWDGLVIRADDPWWDTHWPPNGWRCHCSVRPISRPQLAGMGKTAPDKAPPLDMRDWTNKKTGQIFKVPAGIDPGFGYNPGKAWIDAAGRPKIAPLETREVPASAPKTKLRADAVTPPPAMAAPAEAPDNGPVTVDQGAPHQLHPIPRPPEAEAPRKPRTPPQNPGKHLPAPAGESAETPATPEEVRAFVANPKGSIVIGETTPEVQRAIGAEAPSVRLSAETLGKQGASHPDLAAAEYGLLQAVVTHPSLVLRQDGQRVMLIKRQGVLYRAVVKATRAGDAIYVVSFHRIRAMTLQRLLKQYVVIFGSVAALDRDDKGSGGGS
jgi:hypothetical protein